MNPCKALDLPGGNSDPVSRRGFWSRPPKVDDEYRAYSEEERQSHGPKDQARPDQNFRRAGLGTYLLALSLIACGDFIEGTVFDPTPEELCSPVDAWPENRVKFEAEILDLVNQQRSATRSCGSEGQFGATHSLETNSALRCAARLHSRDMAINGFESHTNRQGQSPAQRVEAVGYEFSMVGENIAWGQHTPEEVMKDWMGSDGHCSNIMANAYTELGVGFYSSAESDFEFYWTQVFGTPMDPY